MNETILFVLVIVALLAVIGWLLYERRRSDELRTTFGSEYKKTVDDVGDRRAAEAELRDRKERVQALEIRPLPAPERERYAERWREVQADFVDEPSGAVENADRLIGEVMEARGYPVTDFEQRVADVSVDHGDVVHHYREAHAIATQSGDAPPDTEALRAAMVHYRALFDDLLRPSNGDRAADRPAPERQATRSES